MTDETTTEAGPTPSHCHQVQRTGWLVVILWMPFGRLLHGGRHGVGVVTVSAIGGTEVAPKL